MNVVKRYNFQKHIANHTAKRFLPDYNRISKWGDMMIKFTKMHGLGNDYVYIDAINQKICIIK